MMTAINWGTAIWLLFAVPWAIGFGLAGWNAGIESEVDPVKAAALAWAIGPFAFPVIRRWHRARIAARKASAIALNAVNGARSTW